MGSMFRLAGSASLLLAAMLVGGCIFVDASSKGEPVYPGYPAGMEKSVTAQEIDAAAGLSYETSRVEALGRVARRPDVSPIDQVYLVAIVFNKIGFDVDQRTLLLALINNPAFTMDAKQSILRNVPRLNFESTRVEVLRAMEGKPATAVARPT